MPRISSSFSISSSQFYLFIVGFRLLANEPALFELFICIERIEFVFKLKWLQIGWSTISIIFNTIMLLIILLVVCFCIWFCCCWWSLLWWTEREKLSLDCLVEDEGVFVDFIDLNKLWPLVLIDFLNLLLLNESTEFPFLVISTSSQFVSGSFFF